ncbi:hypothetical protein ScPMuIL_019014 [Solemya velum]
MATHKPSPPWLIILASFLTTAFGACITYGTGVTYKALRDRYNESVVLTSWLGSLALAVFSIGGPVGSVLINISTCRTCIVIGGVLNLIGYSSSYLVTDMNFLFVTFGVIGGLGQSLCYSASLVIAGFYFEEHRSLASGVAVSGAGVGMLLMPSYTQYLIDTYDLEGAFLLLGATGVQVCVFALLMRPHPLEQKRKLQPGDTKISQNIYRRSNMCSGCLEHFGILRNKEFLLFLVSTVMWHIGNSIVLLYLPSYFIYRGSSFVEAASIMLMMGAGSIFSRILVGFAAVDENTGPRILYTGILGLSGTATCFLSYFASTLPGKVVYTFIYGLYTGGIYALFNSILVELLGIEKLASSFGATLLACGVGTLVGPPIAAFLVVGESENYEPTFFLAGLCIIAGSIFQILMTLKCQFKLPDVDGGTCAGADDIPQDNIKGNLADLQYPTEIQMKRFDDC